MRKINQPILAFFILAATITVLRAGVVLQSTYNFIPGSGVSNLTSSSAYPDSPTSSVGLTNGLAEQVGVTNDFGASIEGYIDAPLTGQYTFWIASADDSQLWLSTDSTAGNAVLIAQNVGAVGVQNYHVKPAQQSASISLTEGQKYFFQVLHKSGLTSPSHCSVAWALPNGTIEAPISANHLWPLAPSSTAPEVLTGFDGTAPTTLSSTPPAVDGAPLVMVTTFEASQPASVQWYSNSAPIPGANLLAYTIPVVSTALNGVTYSVVASNSLGTSTDEVTLSVAPNTTPLTLVDALSLGNPAGDFVAVFSASVNPLTATNIANYSLSPSGTITGARMGANAFSVLLQTSGATNAAPSYALTVNNVQDLSTTPNVIAPGSSIALEQNLTGWYRFDERTGTIAYDSSGSGNNGVFSNGLQQTVGDSAAPDYIGEVFDAVRLDGEGGYVNLPPSSVDFSGGLTIEAWIDPTVEGVNASWARVVDFSNGSANDNFFVGRNGINDSVAFGVYNGNISPPAIISPQGSLATNQWQHIAVTEDGSGNVNLYIDGVLAGTGATVVPNVLERNDMFVGRSPWVTDQYFAGRIDDVRVYNRALSAAAISSIAAGGGSDDVNPSVPVVGLDVTVPTTAEKNMPPGVFTFTRTVSTNNAVTVQYAINGTATNGVDYSAIGTNVTLNAGAASSQVLISPIDLSFAQPSETADLTILPSANYSINFTNGASDFGVVTIIDNDSTNPPTPILVTADSYPNPSETNAINVWFNESPNVSSATSLAGYTLNNAPGIIITSATLLGQSGLGVALVISGPVSTNATLTVTGVQDTAGRSGTFQVPIQVLLIPVNAVATVFHGSAIPGLNTPNSALQAAGFAAVNDDFVNNANNGPGAGGPTGFTGFDTFDQATTESQFAGMLYGSEVDIRAIKVDLGQQFGDGGSWNSLPTVYILKNPINTLYARPEEDPTDWAPVSAQLVSGSHFSTIVGPNPSTNTPIVFSLTNVEAGARAGYGWAVGGVPGDGATGFISVSELRGYGIAESEPAYSEGAQSNSVTIAQGGRTTFSANVTSTAELTYQWVEDGTNISGATDSSYSIPPSTLADNGATFGVVVNGGSLSVTSMVATLNINAQTNPPMLVASGYNPVAETLDLYFSDPVSAASADNPGAYTLNDPGLGIASVTADIKGYFVQLGVYGSQTITNLAVSVTNITDNFGNTNLGQTMPVLPLSWPANNVVADTFQQGRAGSLTQSTNGVVTQSQGGQVWQTFFAPPIPSAFAGLEYGQEQVFKLLKVDLGATFPDGGDYAEAPLVFILKNPVDTDMTQPQSDPTDWIQVPARLITGNVFQLETDGPNGSFTTNTPITFDLTGLPLDERTGYGWAVGGVPANGINSFLSISELSSFQVAALPPVELSVVRSANQVALSWPQAATGYDLLSSPTLGPSAVWTPVNVIPQTDNGSNTVTLPASGRAEFYWLAQ
jgi:hypothetical protein